MDSSIDHEKLNKLTVNQIKTTLTARGMWFPSRASIDELRKRLISHIRWMKSFQFFDKMPKDIVVYFGKIMPWVPVAKLASCNKRLHTLLAVNSVWKVKSRTVDKFWSLPMAWRKSGSPAPDGFWKKWFFNNVLRSITIIPPYKAPYHTRDSVNEIFIPQVGCLLHTPLEPDAEPDSIMLKAWVCVSVTLFTRGRNEGLPKEIVVAPTKQSMTYCLTNRRCDYTIEDRIPIKTRESGGFGMHRMLDIGYY